MRESRIMRAPVRDRTSKNRPQHIGPIQSCKTRTRSVLDPRSLKGFARADDELRARPAPAPIPEPRARRPLVREPAARMTVRAETLRSDLRQMTADGVFFSVMVG